MRPRTMLTCGLLVFALSPGAITWPILEHLQERVETLSSARVSSYKPYTYFAAVAWCNPSQTIAWNCGSKCDARPDFVPIASGGDGSSTQFWYVGYDTSLSQVIVAYEGTDVDKIHPLVTDAQFMLEPLSTTLFPGLNPTLEVHDGFQKAHVKSANAVLAAINTAIKRSGYDTVVVVGHSLGGALALIASVHLRLWLPPSITIHTVTYGMPRVGNQAFVNYVNLQGGNTRINNRHDVIPVLPGRFLGFHQPNVELHILDDLQWVQCAGEDNTNANCTIGYVANILDGIIGDHSGPYDGILMGC